MTKNKAFPRILALFLTASIAASAGAADLTPPRSLLEPSFPWTRVERLDSAVTSRGDTWIAATLSSEGRAARFVVAEVGPGAPPRIRLDVEPPDGGDLERVDSPIVRAYGTVVVAGYRERRACSGCSGFETGSYFVSVSTDGGKSFSSPAEISPLGGRRLFRSGLDLRIADGTLLGLSVVASDGGSRAIELVRSPVDRPGRGEELVLETDASRIGDGDLAPTRLATGEGGIVAALWSGYDGRSSDVFVRLSQDGGQTFAGSLAVSDRPGTSDGFDATIEGSSLVVAWADAREAIAGSPDVDVRMRRGAVRAREAVPSLQWFAPVVVTVDSPGISVDFAPRLLRLGGRLTIVHLATDPKSESGVVGARLVSSEDSGSRWSPSEDLSAPLVGAGFALYGGLAGSFRAHGSPSGIRLLYLGDARQGRVGVYESHDASREEIADARLH